MLQAIDHPIDLLRPSIFASAKNINNRTHQRYSRYAPGNLSLFSRLFRRFSYLDHQHHPTLDDEQVMNLTDPSRNQKLHRLCFLGPWVELGHVSLCHIVVSIIVASADLSQIDQNARNKLEKRARGIATCLEGKNSSPSQHREKSLE
jgi:hypothetical protein